MSELPIVAEFRRCPTARVYIQPARPFVPPWNALNRGDVFIRYISDAEVSALQFAGLIDSFGNRLPQPDLTFTVRWAIHDYPGRRSQEFSAVFATLAEAVAYANGVQAPTCWVRGAVTVTDATGAVVHVRRSPMDALTN